MAPLPPLQSLGFGTSRWRLQGNATLGLRAGGRGHHLFSCRTSVRPWHKADMPTCPLLSAFRGKADVA
jgi:hypothetical protein